MNKETEVTIAVLIILTVIAVLFIRQAIRHRKMLEKPDESQLGSGHEVPLTDKDSYLSRFIFLARPPFKGKYAKIRPQYHEWMKKIIHIIGHDKTSLTAYIDRVLKAHFDDNREVINDLYNDRLDGLFNEEQGDE